MRGCTFLRNKRSAGGDGAAAKLSPFVARRPDGKRRTHIYIYAFYAAVTERSRRLRAAINATQIRARYNLKGHGRENCLHQSCREPRATAPPAMLRDRYFMSTTGTGCRYFCIFFVAIENGKLNSHPRHKLASMSRENAATR